MLPTRHIAAATERTQPVKTMRATGLENIQAALWDVKAIPDDTGSCLLRISTAEGQTLTIINDAPVELYRLPPTNAPQ